MQDTLALGEEKGRRAPLASGCGEGGAATPSGARLPSSVRPHLPVCAGGGGETRLLPGGGGRLPVSGAPTWLQVMSWLLGASPSSAHSLLRKAGTPALAAAGCCCCFIVVVVGPGWSEAGVAGPRARMRTYLPQNAGLTRLRACMVFPYSATRPLHNGPTCGTLTCNNSVSPAFLLEGTRNGAGNLCDAQREGGTSL